MILNLLKKAIIINNNNFLHALPFFKFSCPCGRFVEQKLKLSCSFRCVQIHVNRGYESGHTLLLYSSTTWMIIKPASDISTQRGINLFFSDCSAGKSPSCAGVPARSEELPDR
jgi:hypothetical protein